MRRINDARLTLVRQMLVAPPLPIGQTSGMTNYPFVLPESAADRFLREERERIEFYRKHVGGGVVAEAIRQATSHQKLLRDLDSDRPVRTVLETLRQDQASREAMKLVASTAWAQSVTETAHSILQQSSDLVEQQRRLSSSVLATVRAFDSNRGAVATAMAAAKADHEFRQTIAGMLPELSTYSAIAEQMRRLDMMTLRASEGIAQSATALAAEMVLETHRIAEAIAAAQTDAESTELQGQLFALILGYLSRLGPNTITELQNMGLFQWSGWIAGILGLLLALAPPQAGQSPEENAAFAELSQKVEMLQEETRRYHESETRADEAFVADLPRAELACDATLRRTPESAGEVVLRASRGMVLAIEKREGRWRRVVFRDPLSDQLSRAWVYATALTELADPIGK